MKLQARFGLGIAVVFGVLALAIAAASILWVNQTAIREAEERVNLYIRSSWEIYDGKLARIQSAAETLSRDQTMIELLKQPNDENLRLATRTLLGIHLAEPNVDMLNLLAADGRVVARARAETAGDSLADDPLARQAILAQASRSGTVILSQERLLAEGGGDSLVKWCLRYGGEPRGMMIGAAVPVIADGNVEGLILVGSLLNGSAEKVDRIRDTVFKNEQYRGKPLGTATIFMGDLRISTNVVDSTGQRAVGTRASQEVAERVLGQGLPWTGPAWVVDTRYLSQYDPIRDPEGRVIGMLYVGELEQKYLDIRTRTVAWFLGITLVGMALAFLVFFLIARSIVRPIKTLVTATQQLAAGDLTHRIAVERGDEIGNLSECFNRMAAQLQKDRQEIENDQRALESLNQELQATNRNYMEMLGFVAHELKNPLASATMSLYTVKDGYLGEINPMQRRSLESVATSLDYFGEMIRNYLDLSRLEKGELRINRTRVRLAPQVITPVLDGLESAFQARRMVVINRVPADLEVSADRDLLRIVYDNLLSNAIKYGREDGKVTLEASSDGSVLKLSVYNEGAGVPTEKLPMLFKKFGRLDTPEYAGKKGTGLGLFICREIIEKHQGRIWAESQVGRSTTFIFTLPQEAVG